jgi:DNA polymerase-1
MTCGLQPISEPLAERADGCTMLHAVNGMTQAGTRVLLLDTFGLFYRSFHALPKMNTSAGQPTNAVYGLCTLLLKFAREHRPHALAFALDAPGPTFRHRLYSAYKAGRPALPGELRAQFGLLEELIAALGVPAFRAPGFEADDILATLTRRLAADGRDVLIASGDRDLLQLVSDRVRVLFLGARGKPARLYDLAAVRARFGIEPRRLPSYTALIGDPSDNIPGIAGIGAQTARKLVAEHASIAGIFAALAELGKPALQATLAAHRAELMRNEDLSRLREDLDLGSGPPCAAVTPSALHDLRALLIRLEFRSLLARLGALTDSDPRLL